MVVYIYGCLRLIALLVSILSSNGVGGVGNQGLLEGEWACDPRSCPFSMHMPKAVS